MKAKDDPTIERIRKARHKISKECGHDPQRIVEYYSQLQEKYKDRIISDSEREGLPKEPVKV